MANEGTEQVPKTEDECVAAGGEWKDGKCILPKKGEEKETKEPTETPEELIAKIKQLEDELKESRKDRETLHQMYEEVIENMVEATEQARFVKAKDEADCKKKGGKWKNGRCLVIKAKEEEEGIEFPTFGQWLEDLYKAIQDETEKKRKYPYYPYYPYYPRYPRFKAKAEEESEEEEEKELPTGEGAVGEAEEGLRENLEKIAEMLRTERKVKEQWTAPIVKSDLELVGHVREFLNVDTQLQDKPGEDINIGFVNDFDFGAWGAYGTATLANQSGATVLSYDTYPVEEAGLYFDIAKKDVETIDADVLNRITEMVRRAALRAEDKKVLADLKSNSEIAGIDKTTAGVDFDADWVAELISGFGKAGKSVNPGDIVLFISPAMHEALLKDVAGAMGLVFARPDVIQKGRLTEFMGVTIRIVDKTQLPTEGSQYCAVAFLKKRGHVFAPKRDVLIETDKLPVSRKTTMVATSACAFGLVDGKCAQYIITQVT